MHLARALVQGWAETVLAQLGAPAGHTLTVSGPGFPAGAGVEADGGAAEGAAVAAGEAFGSALSLAPDGGPDGSGFGGEDTGILVTLAFADGSSVGVHFVQPMAEAEAVALLADRLQDAVLEETGGVPQPPCPGHRHPAVVQVVAGVACWACPSGGGGAWPILPAA
ncbi:hypothetical protein [Streptomyces sp. NPDC093097]|uniref:hypothetical protein n=1 Tax=Streptomyces sp. NPDC093097 TaxID=3366027 RepID=UPI00381F63B3